MVGHVTSQIFSSLDDTRDYAISYARDRLVSARSTTSRRDDGTPPTLDRVRSRVWVAVQSVNPFARSRKTVIRRGGLSSVIDDEKLSILDTPKRSRSSSEERLVELELDAFSQFQVLQPVFRDMEADVFPSLLRMCRREDLCLCVGWVGQPKCCD